jgi:hypothetical protein
VPIDWTPKEASRSCAFTLLDSEREGYPYREASRRRSCFCQYLSAAQPSWSTIEDLAATDGITGMIPAS